MSQFFAVIFISKMLKIIYVGRSDGSVGKVNKVKWELILYFLFHT